jgi:hypothetical protein
MLRAFTGVRLAYLLQGYLCCGFSLLLNYFQNIMPQSPELVLEHQDEILLPAGLMLKTDRHGQVYCPIVQWSLPLAARLAFLFT